ncbi:PAS domain-containing sensor histidine kinase [Magnetospirillum sp. UT-4]|uniref:sensor histidine kinase NtrY-like n=1 Tax=Magnetospirillum sp. UT-4 TaxID=2681467 RepID=UPI001574359F|nr:PAS domain-containing sensor histidine kinase [Magnetospirillum sp. UT-4]
MVWARRVGLARKLAFMLAAAVVPSVAATFLAMTVSGPIGPDPVTVLSLLGLDLALLLALGGLVVVRILAVWKARRHGTTGSKLHLRFIVLFALVAVTPAIVVSAGSTVFFRYGVESWFSDRVRTALQASQEVAKAYLAEHQQIIGGDALAMANDINREGLTLSRTPQRFSGFVSTQAAIRGLTEAIVFERQGYRVLARSGLAFSIESGLAQIPEWALDKARNGEVAVLTSDDDDRVRALVSLQGFFVETYLYVGRFVDPKVIGHMEQTSAAVAEYERLEGRRLGLERAFSLVFAVVSLLLLLAAVWVGLSMATKLATPIARLIDAAEKVRSGDLSARVREDGADEVGTLIRAFNRMTGQLDEQRRDLIDTNRELDERNRFTETVLAGVSAGIVGLDRNACVYLPNRSACDLLGLSPEALIGRPLAEAVPELTDVLDEVRRRPDRLIQHEVKLSREGRARTLLVRVAAESLDAETIGYVITFDDITELVSAQRKAAWADVARRIAHEIKNPLTPIQLSAERLKRKYLKEIQSDPETYTTLIETIVRQVGDIGRMVDEFSSFARMPAPQMKPDDLADICRQALFMQRTGYPDVGFEAELPDGGVTLVCDGRLVGQALTNLLKNAVEGIRGREGEERPPGRVKLALVREAGKVVVEVTDNGRGLPVENRDRLTEPYVTTRAKGTGLGLAIVKKIMEDHGGELYLKDAPGGGACVGLVFRDAELPVPESSPHATAIHGA